jgi:hypothetical protein
MVGIMRKGRNIHDNDFEILILIERDPRHHRTFLVSDLQEFLTSEIIHVHESNAQPTEMFGGQDHGRQSASPCPMNRSHICVNSTKVILLAACRVQSCGTRRKGDHYRTDLHWGAFNQLPYQLSVFYECRDEHAEGVMFRRPIQERTRIRINFLSISQVSLEKVAITY